MITIAHLVDDCAMGGVMVALKNFNDLRLAACGRSRMVAVQPAKTCAPQLDDDMIVIHFTVSWRKLPFLMSLRLRNRKAKIILIEHSYTEGFERWNVPNKHRFHEMLKWTYAWVDEVIAVSDAQAAWLSTIVPTEKVCAIPQSRPLHAFKAIAPVAKTPDQPLVFGAIGRFHEQKGFDDLITAFRNPALDGARLLMAGAGPQEARLRDRAGDAANIDFIGPTDDPAAFYAQVDCVVIPSRWEAFGLVASEAMAAGRLVIASNVDGLTEQVRQNGVLVERDTMIALGDAMLSACKLDPEARAAIGSLAREAALGRYDVMIAAWRRKLTGQPCAPGAPDAARASSAAALNPIPIMTRPGQ